MSISLDSIASDLHSIEIKDASGQALAIDGSGFLTITNTSFAVTATDLDIRDLDSAQDNIEIQTAAGQALAIDASGFLTITNTSFAVTATDLDIRDLVFATDKVDVSGSSIVTTVDNMSTWKTSSVSATTTAGEIAATPFTGRSKMIIQNLGNQDVYLSDTNSVAVTDMFLPKGSSFEMNFESDANVWVLTASGTSDLRISEFAA